MSGSCTGLGARRQHVEKAVPFLVLAEDCVHAWMSLQEADVTAVCPGAVTDTHDKGPLLLGELQKFY